MLLSILIIHLFCIFDPSLHYLSRLCVLFLCFMICICSQEKCESGYYTSYGMEVFAMRHLTGEALQSKAFFFILSALIVHYFGLYNECVCVCVLPGILQDPRVVGKAQSPHTRIWGPAALRSAPSRPGGLQTRVYSLDFSRWASACPEHNIIHI